MGGRGRGMGRVLPAWMTENEGGGGGGGGSGSRTRSRTPPPEHQDRRRSSSPSSRRPKVSEIVAELDSIRDERSDSTRDDRLARFVRNEIDEDEFVYEDDTERGGTDALRRYFVNVYYHAPRATAAVNKDSDTQYFVQFLRSSRAGVLVLYEAQKGKLTRCYVFNEDRDCRVNDWQRFCRARRWPIILRYLLKKGVPESSTVTFYSGDHKQHVPLVDKRSRSRSSRSSPKQ